MGGNVTSDVDLAAVTAADLNLTLHMLLMGGVANQPVQIHCVKPGTTQIYYNLLQIGLGVLTKW